MRICYLCSDLGISLDGIKGASAHLRGLVRAFKSLGHELVLITSSANGDAGLGVPVFSIPATEFLGGTFAAEHTRMVRALKHTCNNVMTEKVLLQVVREFQPDVIYERYSPFAVAGGTTAARQKILHVLEVNALLAREGKLYRKQALQEVSEFTEQTAFENSSLILTVSSELRNSIIASGISPEKIVTVPNGVDEMFFRPFDDSIKKQFEGKIVIGFVGSLKPWHGIDILCEAFRKIADEPEFHLLVVGDGPMRKTLQQLDKEFPRRVTCTGGITHEQIPKYIDAMDIAVAPYPELETFYFSPLKVLEYMARGKAIVASGIGQLEELLRHGENGWLTAPGDVENFVDAIRHLKKNRYLRDDMGIKAAEEARSQHSWGHRALSILNLIEKEKTKQAESVTKQVRT
jgi:glycosyltransferase involved in cell wall biosynthesis